MATAYFSPATLRHLRLLVRTGGVCFAVSLAVFYAALPVAAAVVLPVRCTERNADDDADGGMAGPAYPGPNRRMQVALNNMAEGLCMFDREERLVICNRRYLELYKLPAEFATPGTTLAQLLECRIAQGNFSLAPQAYRRDADRRHGARRDPVRRGQIRRRPHHRCQQPAAAGRRLGGDPRGHHRPAQCRARCAPRCASSSTGAARSSRQSLGFRQRVEEHLHSLGDGAVAMRVDRRVAVRLLRPRHRAARRAPWPPRTRRPPTSIPPRPPPTN